MNMRMFMTVFLLMTFLHIFIIYVGMSMFMTMLLFMLIFQNYIKICRCNLILLCPGNLYLISI